MTEQNYKPIIPDIIADILDQEHFNGGYIDWLNIDRFIHSSYGKTKELKQKFHYFETHFSRKLKYARQNGYIRESEKYYSEDEREDIAQEKCSFLMNNFKPEKRRRLYNEYMLTHPGFKDRAYKYNVK